MRARVLACLAVAVCVIAPLLARADHLDVVDPADTKGPLDVVRVEVRGIDKPRFTVLTQHGWKAKRIYDKGFVLIYFDTFGGERFDYYALVRSTGRRLEALLWRDRLREADRVVGSLQVWRPSKRSLAVRVPLSMMRTEQVSLGYSWYVRTLMTNRRCPRVCFDRAPNRGSVVDPAPGVTPTPSLTPSPTPSPTMSPSPSPSPTESSTPSPSPTP